MPKQHPVKSQVRHPEEAREATVTETVGGQTRTLPLVAEKSIQDARPEPRPGHPYLQSARITVPMTQPRLQKGMLLKVKQLLADLGLPPRPLPTKVRTCLYHVFRRGGIRIECWSGVPFLKSRDSTKPDHNKRRCATSTTTCGGTRWSSSRS